LFDGNGKPLVFEEVRKRLGVLWVPLAFAVILSIINGHFMVLDCVVNIVSLERFEKFLPRTEVSVRPHAHLIGLLNARNGRPHPLGITCHLSTCL